MLRLCNREIPVQHLYNPLKQMDIRNIMWQLLQKPSVTSVVLISRHIGRAAIGLDIPTSSPR